jgi:hypothetical protein
MFSRTSALSDVAHPYPDEITRSSSAANRGQQVGRPLYRFGQDVRSKRNRQKCRRAETVDFFGPAPPEVEDPVSAYEVEPPLSAWFPRLTPRAM